MAHRVVTIPCEFNAVHNAGTPQPARKPVTSLDLNSNIYSKNDQLLEISSSSVLSQQHSLSNDEQQHAHLVADASGEPQQTKKHRLHPHAAGEGAALVQNNSGNLRDLIIFNHLGVI